MKARKHLILLIEDNPEDAATIAQSLGDGEFNLHHEPTVADGIWAYEKYRPDAVLLGRALPDAMGIETFAMLRNACPDAPIVMLTSGNTWEIEAKDLGKQPEAGAEKLCLDADTLRESLRAAVQPHESVVLAEESANAVQEDTERADSWRNVAGQLRNWMKRNRKSRPQIPAFRSVPKPAAPAAATVPNPAGIPSSAASPS